MPAYSISVIVPIFNGENFIEHCCEQIACQTLSNIEMILVDDGSKDNSGLICDTMERKYANCKVIHQSNQGVSAARNHGMTVASGQYLSFLDVDDEYDQDMLEILYGCATKRDLDVLMMIDNDEPNNVNVFQSSEEALNAFLRSEIGISSCFGIYKRTLFPQFLFPVGKQIYEDCYALYNAIKYAKKVGTICINKYHYIHREGSNSRAIVFHPKYFDAISVVDEIYDDVKRNFPSLIDAAMQRKCSTYLRIIKIYYLRKAPKDYNNRIKELKGYLRMLNWKQVRSYYGANDRIRYITCLYIPFIFILLVSTIDKK